MDIQFRRATVEDVEAAVPLILSSGPDTFNYVFSHRTRMDATAFLHRAFVTGKGEFGYQNQHVGVHDGNVIALGAGYSGREMLAFSVAALQQILGCYGLIGGVQVLRRGLQAERIVQPPKGDEHYIAHLGVAPEYRGRGIGEQLVQHLLEDGKSRGRTLATLDVSMLNPRAEALYERLGFIVTRELVSNYENETARIPSHRRMEVPIV